MIPVNELIALGGKQMKIIDGPIVHAFEGQYVKILVGVGLFSNVNIIYISDSISGNYINDAILIRDDINNTTELIPLMEQLGWKAETKSKS